jgi:4-amino-4-deoxy-L-arabinose transferase-like glycosyltransferase
MRILGPSLFSKHCFAMVVSLIYLLSIYYIVRKLFSSRAGIMATILTASQALFLAQASMLLPEIMLSLFTLWTLYSYLEKRKLLFLISSSLLILTKETGIFLLILIFTWDLFSFFTGGNLRSAAKKQLGWSMVLAIPLLIFALHLVIQKHVFGWYLFPEHISRITSFRKGIEELGSQEYFLQFYGQIFLVLILVAAFIIQLFRGESILARQKKALRLIFGFILFYLFATTFLFSTPRYLLCIHIMLVILTVFYLDFITKHLVLVPLLLTAALAITLLYNALTRRSNGDYNLGYTDALFLQKKAVEYFERNDLYDHPIYCGFIMRKNMTIKAAGFLEGRTFTHLVSSPDENPEYLILTSTEPEPNYYKIKYDKSDTLIQHFALNYMWMDIYKKAKSEKRKAYCEAITSTPLK